MIKKKFVVLGHTGFIGSRLLTKLSSLSATFEVQGLSLEQLDLTTGRSKLDLTTIFTPESTLVMCAAVKKQLGDTPETFSKNMAMIQNFIRLLQSHSARRVVYLSSAAIYGEDIENLHINEDTPPHPRSYYGLSKFNAEWMLQKTICNLPNTELGIIRPATIYGPGDVANAYGPSGFLNAAMSGKEIILWGDGSEKREFLYIDDVIEILAQYIISNETNPLNIASGTSYTFNDALSAIRTVVTRMPKISSRERSKEKVDNCFDPTRLLALMPNYKFTSLVSGIEKMYRQVSSNQRRSENL